jgi:hypothetical protein
MPVDFAANLYSVTTIGTTVIIADHNSAPKETVKSGLLFSRNTGTAAGGFKWTPEKAPEGIVSRRREDLIKPSTVGPYLNPCIKKMTSPLKMRLCSQPNAVCHAAFSTFRSIIVRVCRFVS